jgi:hypothetical protein
MVSFERAKLKGDLLMKMEKTNEVLGRRPDLVRAKRAARRGRGSLSGRIKSPLEPHVRARKQFSIFMYLYQYKKSKSIRSERS